MNDADTTELKPSIHGGQLSCCGLEERGPRNWILERVLEQQSSSTKQVWNMLISFCELIKDEMSAQK